MGDNRKVDCTKDKEKRQERDASLCRPPPCGTVGPCSDTNIDATADSQNGPVSVTDTDTSFAVDGLAWRPAALRTPSAPRGRGDVAAVGSVAVR